MYSQTAEYALRAMTCLAGKPDQLVPTPVLAKQTQVPPNYLAKVLQQLAGAGLIFGRRGVGGGYKLAKPAGTITLLDVINAVSPIDRLRRGQMTNDNDPALASLHRRADEAAKAVRDIFHKSTLDDLLRDSESSAPHRPARGRGSDADGGFEPTGAVDVKMGTMAARA